MIAQTTSLAHHSQHQPHDTLFRKALQYQVVAQDFFRQHLPNELCQQLDFDSLKFENESFIDDKNFQKQADILYRMKLNQQPGYLYLLVEQQSQTDRWMAYRIMLYVVRIMERHRRLYPKQNLPLVYPLVVYTGHTRWEHPQDVRTLIQAPHNLIKNYFMTSFSLIQTHQINQQQLQQHLWSATLSWVLSHKKTTNVISLLRENLLPHLQRLEQAKHIDYLIDLLQYILDTYQLDPVLFKQFIHTNFTKTTGEKIMTIAEQLRQQGFQQGFQQGKQEGKQERKRRERQYALRSAKRLLDLNMSVNDVSVIVELPIDDLESLIE